MEGDFGIVPEQVAVNGVALSNPGNAPDNPFNGSITVPAARNPAYVNNFGFDADQLAVTVPAGQTRVSIDITSEFDRFHVALLGLTLPL